LEENFFLIFRALIILKELHIYEH